MIPPPEDWDDGIETRWALGLGILGSAILALGVLGGLGRAGLLVVVGAGLVLLASPPGRRRLAGARRPAWSEALPLLLLAPSLVVGLVPPTFYDCATYHVALPQLFLAAGDVSPRPESFYSFLPLLMEMLYTGALGISGVEESSAALHALAGALAILSTAGLARELGLPAAGAWAAVIGAGLPSLLILAAIPKNDLLVTAFVLVALRAGLELTRTGRVHPALGLGIGGALATKHSAIYQCAFLVLTVAAAAALAGRVPRWRGIAAGALLALLMAGPWYLRSYAASGNPVYPTLERVFGSAPFQRAGFVHPVERRELSFAALPGVLRDLATGREGWGSFGAIGPIALPAALLGLLKAARGRALVGAWSLLCLLAWAKTFNQARFLLPVFLALAALGGAGIAALVRERARMRPLLIAATASGIAVGVATFAADVATYIDPVPYLTGSESRDGYLARVFPPYVVFRAANERLPAGARILFVGETRTLYLHRPVLANSANDRTTIVEEIAASRDLADLLSRLRGQRFTHVLVNPVEIARLEPYGPYLHFAGPRDREMYAAFVEMLQRGVVAEHRSVLLSAIPPAP